MANQEHIDILKQGIHAWNAWRKQHLNIPADLSRADLSGADLIAVNLSRADLSRALQLHLVGSKLPWSRFGVRLSS